MTIYLGAYNIHLIRIFPMRLFELLVLRGFSSYSQDRSSFQEFVNGKDVRKSKNLQIFSLVEFIDLLNTLHSNVRISALDPKVTTRKSNINPRLFYRGQRNSNWGLTPSLYRYEPLVSESPIDSPYN